MVPSDFPAKLLENLDLSGIIISGSGSYVNSPHAEQVDPTIYDMGLPILGVCYGMQIMARDLGGQVKKMATGEHGLVQMSFTPAGLDSPLYSDFADDSAPVWMSHNCKVTKVPENFIVTGKTENCEVASIEHRGKDFYGIQYHPEPMGKDPAAQAGSIIYWNFLSKVCGIVPSIAKKTALEHSAPDSPPPA